jgi:hypothetical protein
MLPRKVKADKGRLETYGLISAAVVLDSSARIIALP